MLRVREDLAAEGRAAVDSAEAVDSAVVGVGNAIAFKCPIQFTDDPPSLMAGRLMLLYGLIISVS